MDPTSKSSAVRASQSETAVCLHLGTPQADLPSQRHSQARCTKSGNARSPALPRRMSPDGNEVGVANVFQDKSTHLDWRPPLHEAHASTTKQRDHIPGSNVRYPLRRMHFTLSGILLQRGECVGRLRIPGASRWAVAKTHSTVAAVVSHWMTRTQDGIELS